MGEMQILGHVTSLSAGCCLCSEFKRISCSGCEETQQYKLLLFVVFLFVYVGLVCLGQLVISDHLNVKALWPY